MRLIICLFLLAFFPSLLHAQDTDFDWASIDRAGLYNNAEQGQIGKNIWKDYSQSEAIDTLSRLPSRLAEPVYRSLARKILLSSAPANDEELDAPTLLTKRLELLIQYGFFDEAEELIDSLPDDIDFTHNLEMALIKLQLSLLDGELAPACLDIQASSSQFRDMPAWRELADFCRYRFGSAEKIRMSEMQFRSYPALRSLLSDTALQLNSLNTTEILLAHADNKLFANAEAYNRQAKSLNDIPDLVVQLASQSGNSEQTAYQCYAIESVKRGLRDYDYLENTYKNAKFSDDLLSENSGQVTLHPCDIAAFFYQRIAKVSGDEDKSAIINALLKTTEAMPAIALVPLHEYMANATIMPELQWRAALIFGLDSANIPDSLLPTALPLKNIESRRKMGKDDYIEWLNVNRHERILHDNQTDIAAPLYLLQIINGDFNKLTNSDERDLYENIFSLTYEKKSLNLSLGFNGFMSEIYSNKDKITVLTRLLSLIGDNDISDYALEDVAVILSAFQAYKLEKEGVMLSFEYLQ